MAYVPSLHNSGHSHATEELPASHMQTTPPLAAGHEPLHAEAQPSLLDKAKAYIPVLGSSTEFDPATEARMGQHDRLYRDTPTGQAGLAPEQVPHENLLDKAKAYMPAMGAPGTTSAGIHVSSLLVCASFAADCKVVLTYCHLPALSLGSCGICYTRCCLWLFLS